VTALENQQSERLNTVALRANGSPIWQWCSRRRRTGGMSAAWVPLLIMCGHLDAGRIDNPGSGCADRLFGSKLGHVRIRA
jgi:hypothetical protein